MDILIFALILVISHVGVMQVFRLSTYYRYFWKALPLLVLYSAGVGWAFYALEMQQFFIWQVILSSIWLSVIWKRQIKFREALISKVSDDAEMLRIMESSTSKTDGYFISSSLIYIVVFVATYFWLFNR